MPASVKLWVLPASTYPLNAGNVYVGDVDIIQIEWDCSTLPELQDSSVTISSATLTEPSGDISIASQSISGPYVRATYSGFVYGETYTISATVTLSNGRRYTRSGAIFAYDPGTAVPGTFPTAIANGGEQLAIDSDGNARYTGSRFGIFGPYFSEHYPTDNGLPDTCYFAADGSFFTRAAICMGAGWVQTPGGDSRGSYGDILYGFVGTIAPGISGPFFQLWNDTANPLVGLRLAPTDRTYQYLLVAKDFGPPVPTGNDLDPTAGCIYYGIDSYGNHCYNPPNYNDTGAKTRLDQGFDLKYGRQTAGLFFIDGTIKADDTRKPLTQLIAVGDWMVYSDVADATYPVKIVTKLANGQFAYCGVPAITPPTEYSASKVAEYRFEEASGNRLPTVGAVTLTEVGGTIGQTTGIVGNAVNFIANGRRLYGQLPNRATNTTPFTITLWIYTKAAAGEQIVISKSVNPVATFDDLSHYLIVNAAGTNCTVYTQFLGGPTVSGLTPNAWNFIAYGWNSTDKGWISLNGGTRAKDSGMTSFPIGPTDVYIGAREDGTNSVNGYVDELSIFHGRDLTDLELVNMYISQYNGQRLP